VFKAGETSQLTSGYTRENRAFSKKLLPGAYDIRVQDPKEKTEKRFKGVRIDSGKTQALEAAF
jgi:hypothetical protein